MRKLSAKKVATIQRLRNKGHGYKALAKMLHLSPSTVYNYSKSIILSKEAKDALIKRIARKRRKFAKTFMQKRKTISTQEMAEFTGALLGDGCISKYFSKSEGFYRCEVAFTGSKTDFPYYRDFLQPVIKKYLGVKGRLFTRKDGSTRFHIRSKRAYNFFRDLGIENGKKTANLKIPNTILKSNSLSLACLRGISNTDGCICWQKKSQSAVFSLHMNARALLLQTKQILERNGIFTGNIRKGDNNAFVLGIYRKKPILKFLALVGFSNEHHLNRIANFAPWLNFKYLPRIELLIGPIAQSGRERRV